MSFDKERFINEVMLDWSYRVNDGIPDIKNEQHLILLRTVLEEKKMSAEIIDKVLENIRIIREGGVLSVPQFSGMIDTNDAFSSGSVEPIKLQTVVEQEPIQDDEEEDEEDDKVEEKVTEEKTNESNVCNCKEDSK